MTHAWRLSRLIHHVCAGTIPATAYSTAEWNRQSQDSRHLQLSSRGCNVWCETTSLSKSNLPPQPFSLPFIDESVCGFKGAIRVRGSFDFVARAANDDGSMPWWVDTVNLPWWLRHRGGQDVQNLEELALNDRKRIAQDPRNAICDFDPVLYMQSFEGDWGSILVSVESAPESPLPELKNCLRIVHPVMTYGELEHVLRQDVMHAIKAKAVQSRHDCTDSQVYQSFSLRIDGYTLESKRRIKHGIPSPDSYIFELHENYSKHAPSKTWMERGRFQIHSMPLCIKYEPDSVQCVDDRLKALHIGQRLQKDADSRVMQSKSICIENTSIGAQHVHGLEGIHPAFWGVTYQQLIDFRNHVRIAVERGDIKNPGLDECKHTAFYYDDCKFNDPSIGPNMYQVNEQLIKPWTQYSDHGEHGIPNLGYALMLNSRTGGKQCTVFFSHAWAEGVFEFCDIALAAWPEHLRGPDDGAYICMLSNPQNMNEFIGRLIQAPTDSPFYKVLRSRPELMIMVSNSVAPIHTRLWCVFEAYCAMTLNIPVTMAGDKQNFSFNYAAFSIAGACNDSMLVFTCMLTSAVCTLTAGRYLEGTVTGLRMWVVTESATIVVLAYLFKNWLRQKSVSVAEAQCSNPDDKQSILAAIAGEEASVDDMLRDLLFDAYDTHVILSGKIIHSCAWGIIGAAMCMLGGKITHLWMVLEWKRSCAGQVFVMCFIAYMTHLSLLDAEKVALAVSSRFEFPLEQQESVKDIDSVEHRIYYFWVAVFSSVAISFLSRTAKKFAIRHG